MWRNWVLDDKPFVSRLLQIILSDSLAEECTLGTLQMLSDISNSFREIDDAESEVAFEAYLKIFRQPHSHRNFSMALQGIAGLTLENPRASDYFIARGVFGETLATFEKMADVGFGEQFAENENLKDACMLIHGLAKTRQQFEFADKRLSLVFAYFLNSNDCDIHFDIARALVYLTFTLINDEDNQRVCAGLHILLESGLMKIIVRLIEEADGDVLTIVQACKILSNLAFLKPASAIKEFILYLQQGAILEVIIKSLLGYKIMSVHHLLLTLRTLIHQECILVAENINIIPHLLHPNLCSNCQFQEQIVGTIWETLSKENNEIANLEQETLKKQEVSEPLIKLVCDVLKKEETNSEITMNCLEILDKIMKLSPSIKDGPAKWLHQNNFNGIIYHLQSSRNEAISNMAVSVVSYLDSDESDSEEDEEFSEEYDNSVEKQTQQFEDKMDTPC